MIQSLLIANRGEIAWPFIRTQILLQRGRGTSVAGGGAQAGGSDGEDVGRGSGWSADLTVCPLAGATPPSFGWSPSPFRRGI